MPRSRPEILTSIFSWDDVPLPLATPVPVMPSAPLARTSKATVCFAPAAAVMRWARTAPCTLAPDDGSAVGTSAGTVGVALPALSVVSGREVSTAAKGSSSSLQAVAPSARAAAAPRAAARRRRRVLDRVRVSVMWGFLPSWRLWHARRLTDE
jgi:hypothetical protein